MIPKMYNLARKAFLSWLEASADFLQPPPDAREARLIARMRRALGRMEPLPAATDKNSAWWLQSRRNVRRLMSSRDPRHFLRWEVIIMNMFPAFNRYLQTEFEALRAAPDYEAVWKRVIEESSAGRPIRLPGHRFTSGSAVHAAYHAKSLLDQGVRLDDVDVILEFGGGYGKLCDVFRRLGFRGDYVIYDLPEFSALQELYLALAGAPVDAEGNLAPEAKIACISDMDALARLGDLAQRRCLFVATWSFSETPRAFRSAFDEVLAKCSHFLVAYNARVYAGTADEVDNLEYFSALAARMPHLRFEHVVIPHMPPGNRYLIGQPRTA